MELQQESARACSRLVVIESNIFLKIEPPCRDPWNILRGKEGLCQCPVYYAFNSANPGMLGRTDAPMIIPMPMIANLARGGIFFFLLLSRLSIDNRLVFYQINGDVLLCKSYATATNAMFNWWGCILGEKSCCTNHHYVFWKRSLVSKWGAKVICPLASRKSLLNLHDWKLSQRDLLICASSDGQLKA